MEGEFTMQVYNEPFFSTVGLSNSEIAYNLYLSEVKYLPSFNRVVFLLKQPTPTYKLSSEDKSLLYTFCDSFSPILPIEGDWFKAYVDLNKYSDYEWVWSYNSNLSIVKFRFSVSSVSSSSPLPTILFPYPHSIVECSSTDPDLVLVSSYIQSCF